MLAIKFSLKNLSILYHRAESFSKSSLVAYFERIFNMPAQTNSFGDSRSRKTASSYSFSQSYSKYHYGFSGGVVSASTLFSLEIESTLKQ